MPYACAVGKCKYVTPAKSKYNGHVRRRERKDIRAHVRREHGMGGNAKKTDQGTSLSAYYKYMEPSGM